MKLKHLFLTFSFVVGIFSVAFAQQQQTALNVATTNPSKPMNFAGNEQACFVTNITNSATDGSGIFIDDMQLQIPDGFDLVSLSVAEHTITFVERLTQPQLLLVVGTDTITNGKIQYSDWNTMGEQIIHAESDINGTLTPISKPDDNKCGTYQYQYTIANQCDTLTASITFEVENCNTITCEEDDLVVIDGKTGYTLEDLEVLRSYVQNSATLQPASDGGFTITIQSNCGETTYTLNSCFLDNADMNKDGAINSVDIEMLAHLILEHYKDK